METAEKSDWKIYPISDQAIYIDFGDRIDETLNRRVTALAARIEEAHICGVQALVPTYRALAVYYESTEIRQAQLIPQIEKLLASLTLSTEATRCWEVPVCYGGAYGIDLEDFAAHHEMTTAEVIERHCAARYRIYMIGFMPGFAYLGGLDERLHTPRRESPRLKVPAGTVSIGGQQTAIGSVEAPSGWHLLGRTPLQSFNPEREQPFLYQAGEYVHFFPVSSDEFNTIAADANYQLQWSWHS